jgi:hypothetical protein
MPGMSFLLAPCISEFCDDEMFRRNASIGAATPEEAPSVGSFAPEPQGLSVSVIAFGSSQTRMVA